MPPDPPSPKRGGSKKPQPGGKDRDTEARIEDISETPVRAQAHDSEQNAGREDEAQLQITQPSHGRSPATREVATTRSEGSTGERVQSAAEAWYKYLDGARNVTIESLKRYEAAYHRHAATVSRSASNIPYSEAARTLNAEAGEALNNRDSQRYIDACHHYAATLQEAGAIFQKQFDQSVRQLADEIQKVWTETQEAQDEELQRFVRTMQDILGRSDARRGPVLYQIGQAFIAAAYIRLLLG